MDTNVATQRLQGRLTHVGPGLRDVTLSGERGAWLRAQLTLLDDRRIRVEGTVDFGDDQALTFQLEGDLT